MFDDDVDDDFDAVADTEEDVDEEDFIDDVNIFPFVVVVAVVVAIFEWLNFKLMLFLFASDFFSLPDPANVA